MVCYLCDGPITGITVVIESRGLFGFYERRAHRACADARAAGDVAGLARLRAEACAAGHHRWPGRWTRDPADPYGDASFWECVKGCGHVQRHPGYGINRGIAELAAKLGEDWDRIGLHAMRKTYPGPMQFQYVCGCGDWESGSLREPGDHTAAERAHEAHLAEVFAHRQPGPCGRCGRLVLHYPELDRWVHAAWWDMFGHDPAPPRTAATDGRAVPTLPGC